MKTKNRQILVLSGLLLALAISVGAGGFSLAMLRQQKADIAARIKSCEMQIENIRRLNENLNAQIAAAQNPQALRAMAKTALAQPEFGAVVWAYEKFENAVVERPRDEKVLISFKTPQLGTSKNIR